MDEIIIAKPFVKWVGGKSQLLEDIKNNLPKDFHKIENLTYIEPFVGGGAVLFWILQEFKNIKKAIINDINPSLTNTYKIIKNSPSELITELKIIQKEFIQLNDELRKDYYLEKRTLFNTNSNTNIQNAALFIFLNRTCFNGLYRVNSKGLFNVPFGKYHNPKICDEQTIYSDSNLLQKVEILTGDFSNTLNYATGNCFFYFDPPYKPISKSSNFKSYSKEDFNDAEQIRLKDFCNTISELGYSFILSNSDLKYTNPDNNFFEELYSSYKINRVYASRMINSDASKRGKLSELMISNVSLSSNTTSSFYNQ